MDVLLIIALAALAGLTFGAIIVAIAEYSVSDTPRGYDERPGKAPLPHAHRRRDERG